MKIAGHARAWGVTNLAPFAELRDAGYEAVETFCLTQWLDQPKAFLRLLEESGVTLAAMETGGEWIDPRRESVERDCAERLIEFLSGVGAAALILSGGKRRLEGNSPHDYQTLAALLDDLGQRCASARLRLCYHPKPGTLVEYRDQIELILQRTNPETVFLCLDTCDVAISGSDPLEVARSLASRIGHVHLSDLDWFTHRRVMLGEGVLDLESVVRELKSSLYDGWVTVEGEASEDPLREMNTARQTLRRWEL